MPRVFEVRLQGWDPEQPITEAMRSFAKEFILQKAAGVAVKEMTLSHNLARTYTK